MDWRRQAYLRHQQERWLRPDAARWVRPDAAKFLKPGTRPADVYPALERKYDDNQPRVPAGETGGGQWTSGSGGSGRPRVHIYRSDPESEEVGDDGSGFLLPSLSLDIGDIASEIDKLDLFDIKPRARRSGGVRLAGKPPRGIGDNGGPPLEDPPKIPQARPERSGQRTAVQRAIGSWIGKAINVVISFVGRALARRASALLKAVSIVVTSIPWLRPYWARVETYRDPPRTMDELQTQIGKPGYQRHHIAEEAAARDAGDSENLIQGNDNLAGVPTLKHFDITAEYNRKVKQPDGQMRSSRELLKESDFETRRQYGLEVLRRHGILK